MNQIHTIAFYATILLVILGGILGLIGIWAPRTTFGGKLFLTDVVLAATSLIVAAITKWLT